MQLLIYLFYFYRSVKEFHFILTLKFPFNSIFLPKKKTLSAFHPTFPFKGNCIEFVITNFIGFSTSSHEFVSLLFFFFGFFLHSFISLRLVLQPLMVLLCCVIWKMLRKWYHHFTVNEFSRLRTVSWNQHYNKIKWELCILKLCCHDDVFFTQSSLIMLGRRFFFAHTISTAFFFFHELCSRGR